MALAITAARAAARSTVPLAALAAELCDERGRLDALAAGDPATSVRAVFSWSCQNLTPSAARLFRLLGPYPGPGISASAAASLAEVTVGHAQELLRELAGSHLLAEPAPGRYAFHDLLRTYAAEQAEAIDSGEERRAARITPVAT